MERHRPAEQISLQNATAAGGQSEGLTFGFHAFRDNREIKRSSKLDDRCDHFMSLAIGAAGKQCRASAAATLTSLEKERSILMTSNGKRLI